MLRPTAYRRRSLRPCQPRLQAARGYALLAIFLALSILTISLAVAVPAIKTSIQRERENESIYRARQYVTAIRRYYHKFGAYPPDLAHLKETNNMRFLRREWKDPLTPDGKWRFLHYGDMLQQDNKNPLNGPQNGIGGSGLGGPGIGGNPGSSFGGPGSGSGIGGPGIGNPGLGGPAGLGQGPGSGGIGAFGGPSNGIGGGPGSSPSHDGFLGGGPTDGRSLGGGPIIGVASMDTRPGIHEFRHKQKPSEWLFIYDPSKDTTLRGAGGGGMPPGGMPQGGIGLPGGPPPPPPVVPPSH